MLSTFQYFLEQLEKETTDYPALLPFFKCIFTFYFVFPNSEDFRFTNKDSFINSLSNGKTLPKLKFIFESFDCLENNNIIDYLKESEWWWESTKALCSRGVNIYQLSKLHESLSKPIKKKTTGAFFTPKSQVQFISRYGLYLSLKFDQSLAIEESTIHKVIFQGQISGEKLTVCKKFIDKMSSMVIIDPSCGTGLFLHEIIEIFDLIFSTIQKLTPNSEFQGIYISFLTKLRGYDIDPTHITLTKFVFLHHWLKRVVPYESTSIEAMKKFLRSLINIKEKDFLVEEDDRESFKYDLCVGNPPYIRHHDIHKKKIINNLMNSPIYQSVFSDRNNQIDSKADLYFYFWIKLMLKLHSNGVLGLVLSRSWYSSRFLAPINSLLFEKYFNIDLVLELPSEPWKTAEIITNIIIGHKIEHPEELQYTDVLVWKNKAFKLLKIKDPLSNYLKTGEKLHSMLTNDIKVESSENEDFRTSQITNSHKFFSKEKMQQFPLLRLDYLTMAPFLLHEILLKNKDKFCLLSQLGKLSLGSTTGANKFFYLSEEKIQNHGLSQEILVPMTKSPKDNISLSTISPKKPLYLLYIPYEVNIEEDEKLQQYLHLYKDDLLSRPYFVNKSKSNWFRIRKIQPEIIIPNMTYLRSFVAYNKQKLHIDKQWIGFWPDNPTWTEFLLGFMNSSLGMLLREIQGTRSLGLGSLKLSLRECQNLLVLDPRLFSNTFLDQIGEYLEHLIEIPIPKFGEKTKYSIIQKEMDKLICIEYLGLAPQILDQIRESIKFEVEWRLGKPIL